jgi:monofunctional biosynthetic peptidoglycan transglycosylase
VSEDDIFFQHKGVRVEDMQKAWEKNQEKRRKGHKATTALRGGSTITQQLAKNLFLSSEQNYFRKAQELVITGLLEVTLSKQRLFEIYLNSVEWGEGIFGIGAASAHYYATSPGALDRDQSAALASALPAPKCFDKQQYCRKANIHFPTRQEFILEYMDRVALTPTPKSSLSK